MDLCFVIFLDLFYVPCSSSVPLHVFSSIPGLISALSVCQSSTKVMILTLVRIKHMPICPPSMCLSVVLEIGCVWLFRCWCLETTLATGVTSCPLCTGMSQCLCHSSTALCLKYTEFRNSWD